MFFSLLLTYYTPNLYVGDGELLLYDAASWQKLRADACVGCLQLAAPVWFGSLRDPIMVVDGIHTHSCRNAHCCVWDSFEEQLRDLSVLRRA